MCIAIVNNGQKISKEAFKMSLYNNPDGFGMAYIEGTELKVFKSLSLDLNHLYKKYSKIYDSTEFPILLHFRIGTSGKNDLNNCHPFNISKNLVLIHNGILKGYGSNKANLNDTRHYIREVLSNFKDTDLINNKALHKLISNDIEYNKFCLLHSSGQFTIVNEALGHWDETDNWFSNSSYKPYDAKKSKISFYGWSEDDLNDDPELVEYCEGCNNQSNLEYSKEYNCLLCKDCFEWIETDNI
jgi:predicted glutamine amidotransferase